MLSINQLEELTNECMRLCPSKRIEAVNCEIIRDDISILPFRTYSDQHQDLIINALVSYMNNED